MKSNFKENFNFYTNIFLLCIIFFGGIAYADTNGIWHYAADIVPGIFGENEGANPSNSFIFMNQVDLNENTRYKGVEIDSRFVNENQANSVTSNMIIDGAIGIDDIDDSQIQRVISDICPSDQSIRAINTDGSVVCEVDSILDETQVDLYVSNNGYLTSYTETDPTVPANIKDGISWSEISGIPTDIADGDVSWSEISGIPTDFVNGHISWSEISGIPAGFADGVDATGSISCSCGTCFRSKHVSSSCDLGYQWYELCTPSGWIQTSVAILDASCHGDNNDLTPEELEFYKKLVKENKDLINKGKRDKFLN